MRYGWFLSSIPIHQMVCFQFTKWVIDSQNAWIKLEEVSVGENKGGQCGVSFINCSTVRPKKIGGIGVFDIDLQNLSLLLRWWWMASQCPTAIWIKMITRLIKMVRDICSWSQSLVSGMIVLLAPIAKNLASIPLELQMERGNWEKLQMERGNWEMA